LRSKDLDKDVLAIKLQKLSQSTNLELDI